MKQRKELTRQGRRSTAHSEKVAAAVLTRLERRIPNAFNALDALLADKNTPPSVLFQVAKYVIDKATPTAAGPTVHRLEDMQASDLEAFIRSAQAALDDVSGQIIEGSAQVDAQGDESAAFLS